MAEGEKVEAAEDSPSIDTIAALSDDELLEVMGFKRQIAEARKALAEMQKLTGDARKYAEERIVSMFTPHVYPSEFKYIVEDAQRKAKKQDGKAALCDCSPCSVLD